MNHELAGGAGTAVQLRRAFDESFAEPASVRTGDAENLLRIRLAGDPYALRLDHVAGLFADRKLASVPSPAPDLLGIAGLRGAIVPVYSLRLLLGYPTGEPPRWIALVRTSELVGVAFDAFEGYLRVARSDLAPAADAPGAGRHIRMLVRADATLRPIIDVLSVVETLEGRAHRAGPWKER